MLLATTQTASKSPSTTTRLGANAGLILPATLALHLGLPPLVDRHLDLGNAPGRANTDDNRKSILT